MKAHLDIGHEGTLGDVRTRMTFDENSIAHLMGVLTDLYSDPAMAVIREYSTNAIDAHRAAGETRPIEVELPTYLNAVFVVRDFGPGMSVDGITNNFSKYGWSSKRDTDNEVGMLGLGCKSALSYTSQFTLVTNHNGVQAVVLVTRESDGAGAVQIIDTSATSAPNGFVVQVPVSNVQAFNTKANDFYRFSQAGTVMVNGKEPTDRPESGTDAVVLADDLCLIRSDRYAAGKDVVIMGNVPYPVDDDKCLYDSSAHQGGRRDYAYRVVVRVPIGSVDFAPSREALHYTKRTLETLAGIRERIIQLLVARAEATFANAANATEALRLSSRWNDLVPRQILKYKGADLPTSLPIPTEMAGRILLWQLTTNFASGHSRSNQIKHLKPETALTAVHVLGYKMKGLTATTKEKLFKLIVNERGLAAKGDTVLLYPDPFCSPWLDNVKQVTWDTVKAVDLGRPTVTVPTAKYRRLSMFGTRDLQTCHELPPVNVAWMSSEDQYDRPGLSNHLCSSDGFALTVLVVSKRSVAKFVRDHPTVPHVKTWIEERWAQILKETNPAALWMFRGGRIQWENSRLAYLREVLDQLYDRELADFIKSVSMVGPEAIQTYERLQLARLSVLIDDVDTVSTKVTTERLERLGRRYPMLCGFPRYRDSKSYDYHRPTALRHTQQALDYANAIYLMRTTGNAN